MRGRLFKMLVWYSLSAGIFLSLGCEGKQSALDTAGREARELADLFWWMTAGAVLIWVAVIALAFLSVRAHPDAGKRRANSFIITGGAVVPTVVLAGLLAYGLWILPAHVAPAPAGSLRITVNGELWWWRVRYQMPDGKSFELANEIHLPVGKPVQFELRSSNVIHSFWIPSLSGKRDMIPGRVTHLALTPTETGVFRAQCAEYCGASHALMSFFVVVTKEEEFSRWVEDQMKPGEEPAINLAALGRKQFLANGCGACHTIRGTPANSPIGPDLTHVGSRLSIGAGSLPTTQDSFVRWIAQVHKVKPGVLMPHFSMLPNEELLAIAVYLEGLK